MPGLAMGHYLGLKNLTHVDGTNVGGSSPELQLGHAMEAIASGRCKVALVMLADRPKSHVRFRDVEPNVEMVWDDIFGIGTLSAYSLAATRHMYEYGTTLEQMAWVKVAASEHAQHNPHALLKKPVTVEEVMSSRMLSDPLRMLDCCVVTDSGGAVVLVAPEVAAGINRPKVKVLGQAETIQHAGTRIDLTGTGGRVSGPRALAEAGVSIKDVDYASIYDSFTITVIETLEDLGFCEKGKGGEFVADGGLRARGGKLPVNTDGGGLCNNHPGMGGMMKLLEAVRQIRGEAHPEVQVPNCDIALVHGTGGTLGMRMASSTVILGTEDA
jgi:acetyl-CoA C-acetyltransferase